ncbi:TIGR02302 family protein [Actibacterium lipolyticum]|uniref:TIGR02302 family protein n=1 Tax=Actibacterium lipolyticum TaxID=1524263 RepID=A0A238KRB6_9RHOB|nr:TIGR02302 family protein [Actibacterium lipolyticum]SMX45373.1 hypothetical protein COL8621_02778 [Actibacterium lipolyticum]
MTDINRTPEMALKALARPLRLTRWGMVAERATRAFWPLWTVLFLILAALAFGLHEELPVEAVWAGLGLGAIASVWALVSGWRAFHWPKAAEALERLDQTLPGRPITALADTQAIGAGDAASEAVWKAHLGRMAERVQQARAVSPDLRVSARDRYGLRYVAVTLFAAAVLFGSLWRVTTVADIATGPGAALASGPAWEGWVEPPAYTSKPTLYLNDIAAGDLTLPQGSRVTLRLYGEVGSLTVTETVSAGSAPAQEMAHDFEVDQEGSIAIAGPGGREWAIAISPDAVPVVTFNGTMERKASGEMQLPFTAADDYGVLAGKATITLDLASVDRRFGLAADPEPREKLVLDLPMPITGNRASIEEVLVDNLSEHPWVGLPVNVVLSVEDAKGQEGQTEPLAVSLPGRRFFDTLAKAIIEQRRDLLWTTQNAGRVAQVLRAVSYRPDDIFRDGSTYLQLRTALRQLEANDVLSPEVRDEIAQVLWDIALKIEDGNLADALERLRRAQDRLSEAMRNGVNEDEIADLMQELRDAMDDYIRQLAEQQQQDGQQQQLSENQQSQEITGDQLQDLLDRIQELMEQGRMAEAQQLLDQLSQMMENMRVTQGQNGSQSPGQQALDGLGQTLREQQGLSDEAFRDLQEQFNPNGQPGQNGQGQGPDGEQEGGETGEGQQGQGQNGEPQDGQGGDPGQSLADRQRALRNELRRQEGNLPGVGGEEGEAARDALDRAGRAMDRAEGALRQDDLAGALDNQSQAMEALREGMRSLGEALAQQQQQGQQGEAMGQAPASSATDPLGRESGSSSNPTEGGELSLGDGSLGRARELMDEIRRRSFDQTRPEAERDYLKRLLDRF